MVTRGSRGELFFLDDIRCRRYAPAAFFIGQNKWGGPLSGPPSPGAAAAAVHCRSKFPTFTIQLIEIRFTWRKVAYT